MGLIELEAGTEPEQARAELSAYLGEDVQVFTHEEYVEFEVNDIKRDSPIGFIFGDWLGDGIYRRCGNCLSGALY